MSYSRSRYDPRLLKGNDEEDAESYDLEQRFHYQSPPQPPRMLFPASSGTSGYHPLPRNDVDADRLYTNEDHTHNEPESSALPRLSDEGRAEAEGEEDGDEHHAPASLLIEQPKVPARMQRSPRRVSWFAPPASQQQAREERKAYRMSREERALWKWINVENMDRFFERVYAYYLGKGRSCIILSKTLNLLTLGFVIGFTTFLVGCVDFHSIKQHHRLADIVIPQCLNRLSPVTSIFLLAFGVFWVLQLLQFLYEIHELNDMYNFFDCLLKIPEVDMQTISWPEVVNRIIQIRENNPTTSRLNPNHPRLNAHDIANRIMRKENYLIALFNKDLLDIAIPLPYFRHRPMLTKTLEWNLSFCILDYVFDEHGAVRVSKLRETNRQQLVEGLRRRFIFMGFVNLIFAPFIVVYLLMFFFFRYFTEYHKNPSSLGSRSYSPFARWKFREFNELPHLFQKRLNSSYPAAVRYLEQFPKEKTVQLCRFVAFISGSFAAVLAVLTVLDQELLINFELSPDKSILFYIGLFGSVFAIARGLIPDETLVFEPELTLKEVVEHTHYLPGVWRGKLHTDEVKQEFSKLFDYKVALFLQEILSVVFTPLILWYSLPKCSEAVVDFFREFTVHVDGVGYVCSFAVFDFKRHGNIQYGAPSEVVDEYYLTKEGKMEKSFLNFKANNPDWEPTDPSGSIYLECLNQLQHQQQHNPHFGSAILSRRRPPYASGQGGDSDGVAADSSMLDTRMVGAGSFAPSGGGGGGTMSVDSILQTQTLPIIGGGAKLGEGGRRQYIQQQQQQQQQQRYPYYLQASRMSTARGGGFAVGMGSSNTNLGGLGVESSRMGGGFDGYRSTYSGNRGGGILRDGGGYRERVGLGLGVGVGGKRFVTDPLGSTGSESMPNEGSGLSQQPEAGSLGEDERMREGAPVSGMEDSFVHAGERFIPGFAFTSNSLSGANPTSSHESSGAGRASEEEVEKREKTAGVIGLLNQLYELNNAVPNL
ncbi:uncharacterized protein VTP21DRAFT_4566 [Calcarisporiella thermophila]|uniref:uncharacterized protein n=1 Tax=Calcarisporiella thermophila TaxID=911321 RepID=UPI003743A7BB